MSFTNKVDELAEFFKNNYDKVKELPTSLAGAITSAVTAVPKAPVFSQSSAKEDDPYPNMIRTIEDMLDTITEGNAYDKFKPQLRPTVDPFKDIRPKERPTVKETSTATTATKEPRGLIKKPKAFELNSIPREIFSKKGESYSLTDIDIDTMAKTIAAEAQGESLKGQIGVGYVILNRTLNEWQGKETVTDIIKSPYQFSAWNEDSKIDPTTITPDDDSYKTALKVIEGITSSRYKDPTGGAAYYWNPKTAKRKIWMSPAEKENKLTIGKHTFAGQVDDPFKYIYKPVKR
mgnify:CR=1 FL=1